MRARRLPIRGWVAGAILAFAAGKLVACGPSTTTGALVSTAHSGGSAGADSGGTLGPGGSSSGSAGTAAAESGTGGDAGGPGGQPATADDASTGGDGGSQAGGGGAVAVGAGGDDAGAMPGPSLPFGGKRLDGLTLEERKTYCDVAAAALGGYGSVLDCGNGLKRSAPKSQDSCLQDFPPVCDATAAQAITCLMEATCENVRPSSCSPLEKC